MVSDGIFILTSVLWLRNVCHIRVGFFIEYHIGFSIEYDLYIRLVDCGETSYCFLVSDHVYLHMTADCSNAIIHWRLCRVCQHLKLFNALRSK